jgi:signal transduction histidine kinase
MTSEVPRTDQSPAIVVTAIAGLVVAVALLFVSVSVNRADDLGLAVPAFLWLDYLAITVVGVVVALARPMNPVGWLMLGAGELSMVGDAALALANHDLLYGGHIRGASLFAVTGGCARTVGWYLATVWVPLFFPDGRRPSGRWRVLIPLGAAGIVTGVLGCMFATHAQLDELPNWQNPLSSHGLNSVADPLSGVSLLLNVTATICAVVRLASRWRHGDPLLRQQIGLFAAVAVLPIFAVILGVSGVTGAGLFAVTLLPLPIGIGFAVLARGLYDLATATNRTLVWLTLSATIVGIYALVIVGVSGVLHTHGASWLPWVAAAVVAISFAPLRDALQRGVNRLTFGRWDDPYQVLAALGQHLEASADVDRLLADVTTELESTLGLRQVAILDDQDTVLVGGAANALPDKPLDRRTVEQVPLVAYGRRLGTLRFTAAVALRTSERRVLDDLAGHLAGLLHARALTRDLQGARERLVLAREEERRRLRRDLHDGLGPALAGQVLRLDLASRRLPAGSAARHELESLRDEAQGTVAEVRRVVEGLRPPALDEVGLGPAVTQLVRRLTTTAGLVGTVEVADLPPLSAAVEVATYRIVAEAVTNVVRHSDARRCEVWLRIEDGPGLGLLAISVRDDGTGLADGEYGGHGLDTMRERAEELGGRLSVTSAAGTTACAWLPIETNPRADAEVAAAAEQVTS